MLRALLLIAAEVSILMLMFWVADTVELFCETEMIR
jgi:hypothetical protein